MLTIFAVSLLFLLALMPLRSRPWVEKCRTIASVVMVASSILFVAQLVIAAAMS